MITGSNEALYIENCVDSDGDLELGMLSHADCVTWIKKDQALEIVRHLIKVFDIKELNERG